MNYDASELVAAANELTKKLDNISPSELQQLTQVPGFDQFSQQAAGLLPNNFIKTGIDGVKNLLNPTNLASQLTQGLNQIAGSIQSQATGMLNAVAGKVMGSFGGFNAGGLVDQASSLLSQMSDAFSIKSADQMVGIFSNLTQGAQFGNIQSAMQSTFDAASNLTPKGIRDLANPAAFQSKLASTVNNAKSSITDTAKQMAVEQAQGLSLNSTGQLPLQQLSSPKFSGDNSKGYPLAAYLTVYWSKGSGTDIWTAAKMSSTGRVLAEGVSAAVDPVIIPYLSRIDIPYLGTRFAVDTGGAVKARKASGGRRPVIDVYFEKKQDAMAFITSIPTKEVVVTVYPPKGPYKYAKYSSPTYGTA